MPVPVLTIKPTPVTFATFGNGYPHLVGKEIAPGTYRTRQPPGFICNWQRLGQNADDVIASDRPTGPTIVTIAPSDMGFLSDGCGTWTQDLRPMKQPTGPFFDGTFFVGLEIAPGTWRTNAVGRRCSFARLSGFGSGDGFGKDRRDIIALGSGSQSGDTFVTTGAADKGFTSTDCGQWIKVG